MNPENESQKKQSKIDQVTFSYNLDLKKGHSGGGRASHFFYCFFESWVIWVPLGSKWCPGPHHETIFLQCWVRFVAQILKNVLSSGKQNQTPIEVIFENWRAFLLFFVIFGLILCAEYSSRGNGSSGGYREEC